MQEILSLPPRKLREQIAELRPHSGHGPLYAVFTACKSLGEDMASVTLYSVLNHGDALLGRHPLPQALYLPTAGNAILLARHVRLIRCMLRRYGRVGVEICDASTSHNNARHGGVEHGFSCPEA